MNQSIASISSTTRRRFILGRQGLWPGRRWSGKEGTARAIHYCEAVQVDPVSVVAQSHDIVLWGRVLDYQPGYLTSLAYEDRQFFDYGGSLFIYPMDELPYWRIIMDRSNNNQRWLDFRAANPKLIAGVKQELRQRGPLRNREFDGNKVEHYRAGKDTGIALYYLWLTGELMTHRRYGKERVYDFLENVAPQGLHHRRPENESIEHFIRKAVAQRGLVNARTFRTILQSIKDTPVDLQEAKLKLAAMVELGRVTPLAWEDSRETIYCLAEDFPLLEKLIAGQIPQSWQPLETSTDQEVTILSPLEYVSARRRALNLFDFDYIWEIYKPAGKRVYGPYTMPILYGDQLVARIDARLDRPNQTLIINGFWLEPWFKPDEAFAKALAKGLARFLTFLEAEHVASAALKPKSLRQLIDSAIG
jgi:uncharacterized protein YcaQ